jgi:hypothetical protein
MGWGEEIRFYSHRLRNVALLLNKPSFQRLVEIGVLFLLVDDNKKSFTDVHDLTMKKFQELNDDDKQ